MQSRLYRRHDREAAGIIEQDAHGPIDDSFAAPLTPQRFIMERENGSTGHVSGSRAFEQITPDGSAQGTISCGVRIRAGHQFAVLLAIDTPSLQTLPDENIVQLAGPDRVPASPRIAAKPAIVSSLQLGSWLYSAPWSSRQVVRLPTLAVQAAELDIKFAVVQSLVGTPPSVVRQELYALMQAA